MNGSEVIRDKDGFAVLTPKCSRLYRNVNYLAKPEMVINRIFEYDIKSANTSALRGSKKLSPETLVMLDELPKHEREVYVGKMIILDKSIRETIAAGIASAKMQLFMANNIQDDEVHSIKNDAVFIVGRRLRKTEFGTMVFKEKSEYAMYMLMDKIEYYYDRKHHTVSIKGISDKIVEHPDHQKGMCQFFADVMEFLVMDRKAALRKFLINFSSAYKRKELPIEYYREMSRVNAYRTDMQMENWSLNLDQASTDDLDMIDGTYNYKRFVLPVIQRFI